MNSYKTNYVKYRGSGATISLRRTGLPHRQHHELRVAPDDLGPAGRDRLQPCIEPHAFHPLHVMTPEGRLLPTVKGMKRHRHQDWDIDADDADLDVMREGTGAQRVALGFEIYTSENV